MILCDCCSSVMEDWEVGPDGRCPDCGNPLLDAFDANDDDWEDSSHEKTPN